MIVLVFSDLHLGKGKFFNNGQINILEDFFEDRRFVEFLDYYSSGEYLDKEVHLILNGDILNLIQIDIDGVFSHIIDEKRTVAAINLIYNAHREFFHGLKKFLNTSGKKLSYGVGNHDAGMGFEGAQSKFNELVGGKVDFFYELDLHGIHIEHGHRFELINASPKEQHFTIGPNGSKILNLPWGSLFCINVLPQLRKERPYLDKVRPMTSYVKWCLIHDFMFFWHLAVTVVLYIIKTNFDLYTKQNRSFKTSFGVLKQITIYPKYEKKAKKILKENVGLHTVIMGHTHVVEWRRFPERKYYFNTGTWNSIPSIDAGLHENMTSLNYIMIEVNKETRTLCSANLNIWQGKWRPFREEIATISDQV